jgi:WD40 repeat protein/tetratricopeptide (TPR) repeat protein
MYDLDSAKRLWRVEPEQSHPDRNLAFTPDSRRLCVTAINNTFVMDCQSGEMKQTPSPRGRLFVLRRLVKQFPTGRPLQVGICMSSGNRRSICLQDALSGEVLAEANAPALDAQVLSQLVPAPDGRHVGLIRRNANRVEVLDLVEERLILATTGDRVFFSREGKLAAIAESEVLSVASAGNVSGDSRALGKIKVWDLAEGRLVSTMSLAGNYADEVRLSPDNRRLVTLHGKRANGSGGAVPQARLWDVSSGREIMSIPVADINHYVWELEFDDSGHRLTTLVLAKAWGTAGGWGSTVYDATPLGDQEDAKLIARRLVDELRESTPLPREMVDALKANANVKPLARDVAIEMATRLPLEPDNIVSFTLSAITSSDRSQPEYQQALRWAEALRQVEPDSVRSAALLGGAQFRSGNFKDALATLTSASQETAGGATDEQIQYDFLGKSFLSLALAKNGQVAEAHSRARRLLGTYSSSDKQTPLFRGGPAFVETWNELSRSFRPTGRRFMLSNAPLPDANRIDQLFATSDTSADGKLTETEAASTPIAWSEFLVFDENRDAVISQAEFRKAVMVNAHWRLAGYQLRDGLYEAAAKNLDEAVKLAPANHILLNRRAWLRATCPDERFRNGKRAVEDATKACELTNWKNSIYVDTLAAALAEVGDFANAIQRQEQALTLANAVDKIDSQPRLDLYKQNKPFRTPVVGSSTAPSEHPLLSSDIVANARRVAGWGASWSPDGKKLVRNLIFQSNHRADLEIIDLETGATTKLCNGGADPFWSPLPGGPIAFARGPRRKSRTPINESIWLVNPDGSELRELGKGGFPSWANDGRLFYRTISGNNLQLIAKTIDLKESTSEASPIPGTLYPTISPDGTLVAMPTQSRLTIRDRANNADIASLDLEFGNLVTANWSPDGRYVAYGAYSTGFPGLWLWDFRAGTKRLLTTEPLTMPRWSPDGKYIAADARALNEVVLLDVLPLNLQNGLPAVPAASDGGNVQATP